MLPGTRNSVSCLYGEYQAKGSTDREAPGGHSLSQVEMCCIFFQLISVHSSSSLSYLSAGFLLRSPLVTHQYHNLITHKPLGRITKRHSNHADSTARGNVKAPSLLLLRLCTFCPLVGLLLFSSFSDLSLPSESSIWWPFSRVTDGSSTGRLIHT